MHFQHIQKSLFDTEIVQPEDDNALLIPLQYEFLHQVIPVSYTHLDVYKRQYDKNREFMLTSSPSMDILISSNLERLIYRIAGNDAEKNAALMRELTTTGKYEITPEMRAQLKDFYGNYTSEAETAEVIRALYEKTGYVIDTHTAVAAGVYGKYKKDTGDVDTKTVIASTASPFKFTRSVMDRCV